MGVTEVVEPHTEAILFTEPMLGALVGCREPLTTRQDDEMVGFIRPLKEGNANGIPIVEKDADNAARGSVSFW